VPPLRERKEDILELVEYFLQNFAKEYGQKPKKITDDGFKALEAYEWPGNVRELRNVIERLVIMTPSNTVTSKNIIITESQRSDYFSCNTLREAREFFEKDFITRKLEENNWNISKTAEALDIERSNLHRKIKTYDIHTP
jgi:two-component system nitrogen regulation response regulator NtrX